MSFGGLPGVRPGRERALRFGLLERGAHTGDRPQDKPLGHETWFMLILRRFWTGPPLFRATIDALRRRARPVLPTQSLACDDLAERRIRRFLPGALLQACGGQR